MKVRDSGMPEQDYWESLFDVRLILDRLNVDNRIADAVEIGCGYGTFTLPIARRIGGTLHALDFEPEMIAATRARAAADGIRNVRADLRDVLADGLGVPAGSVDAVLLFNLLHMENPVALLRVAVDALRSGGRVLAIHWRSDVATPRGPDLAIRPRPEQIASWAAAAGLRAEPSQSLPPWHFGLAFWRET